MRQATKQGQGLRRLNFILRALTAERRTVRFREPVQWALEVCYLGATPVSMLPAVSKSVDLTKPQLLHLTYTVLYFYYISI